MRFGRTTLAAILLLLGLGFSTAAQAFVLPSSYVLGEWVRKTRKVKTIYIRQRTTIYDSKLFGGSVAVEEEIWIRRPNRYRRTTVYPNGKYEVIAGKDRVVRIWGEKVDLLPLVDALGPLGALYVYSDKERLTIFMRQMGIDVDQTRWTLSDKKVGLEIGAQRGRRLAFVKDELVPLRADVGRKNYRFSMEGSGGFPIRYPKTIEVYEGDRLVEKTEVSLVKVGVRIDKNRFEIPAFAKASRSE